VVSSSDTDEELATLAGSGDRDAFASLYSRHAAELFDFAVRTLRDRDSAADVVQTTFVKAWESLHRSTEVRNVRAWLFTIARNAAMDELRGRRRVIVLPDATGGEAEPADTSRYADPQVLVRDRELADLVWSAAAALSRDEYALLDLHVRRGFDADELAAALGLRKGAVYTRLSRLKDTMASAVSVRLLVTAGRRDCADLDTLLRGFGPGRLDREVRRAVETHAESCETCAQTRRRVVSPVEVFAGLTPVAAAPGTLDEVWVKVGHASAATPAAAGPPERLRRGRPVHVTPLVAAGSLLALLVGSGVSATALVLRARSDRPVDPVGVSSPTHQLGVPSTRSTIVVEWRRQPRASAYSIDWSRDPQALPDQRPDLPGNATRADSPPLTPGDWWFSLRTRGRNGDWTSTVRLGAFKIRPAESATRTAPTASPSPSATPSAPVKSRPSAQPSPPARTPRPTTAPPAPRPTVSPTTVPAPSTAAPSTSPTRTRPPTTPAPPPPKPKTPTRSPRDVAARAA
jgi:RNA polymerase sigma factor (sigma-70 family)